jgi:Thiol:disulfide interchange protein DsbD, N-terminal/AhpC/TSA family
VSYDPVEVLAGFAERRGITYDLLSDDGSRAIRSLGLLNEHVEEQHAHYGVQTREHHRGVPYPGIFILDERGVVVDKRFEQSYRTRPTAASVLEEGFGVPGVEPAVAASAETGEIKVTTWLASATYRPYQKLRLGFSVVVASGLHVYGAPIPEGLTPLTVTVEPREGFEVGEVELPEPRLYEYEYATEGLDAPTDEPTFVYEGTVRGALSLAIVQNLGEIEVGVRVRYQACGDAVCYPPAEVRLSLPLKGLDNLRD